MWIVDANVILRYVLDDHAELSQKARRIIDEQAVEIPVEVLCEVVYVLSNLYQVSSKDIGDALTGFLESTACALPHREALLKALKLYSLYSLDFVDCLLAAYYEIENISIHTFDTKLNKLLALIAETKK